MAIEVLETVLIKTDADLVVRNLRGLASAGFHVELDDFGTGHASIANLRRFMVNRIKIDRSFVTGIETSEEQQTLTASMIAMAHALGIATLAEGRRDRGRPRHARPPRLRRLPGLPRRPADVARRQPHLARRLCRPPHRALSAGKASPFTP